MFSHAFAHSLIGKSSITTKHIIDHVFYVAGLGYHRGNRWMRQLP